MHATKKLLSVVKTNEKDKKKKFYASMADGSITTDYTNVVQAIVAEDSVSKLKFDPLGMAKTSLCKDKVRADFIACFPAQGSRNSRVVRSSAWED